MGEGRGENWRCLGSQRRASAGRWDLIWIRGSAVRRVRIGSVWGLYNLLSCEVAEGK